MNSDTIEFVAIIARELPETSIGQLADTLPDIMRIGRQLNRMNVEYCNTGNDDEPRRERLTTKARELAQSIGATAIPGTDARGYSLFLRVPSGMATDIGKTGIGIPC